MCRLRLHIWSVAAYLVRAGVVVRTSPDDEELPGAAGHGRGADRLLHGRHLRPAVGEGVVALHAGQPALTVVAAHRVHLSAGEHVVNVVNIGAPATEDTALSLSALHNMVRHIRHLGLFGQDVTIAIMIDYLWEWSFFESRCPFSLEKNVSGFVNQPNKHVFLTSGESIGRPWDFCSTTALNL